MINIEFLLTIISIILGCISLLFTIFTISLGIAAFLGWKNIKDINKIKKLSEIQYNQICNESSNLKAIVKQSNIIFKSIKKEKNKKHLREQEKEINELICKMDKIVEKAENKLTIIESSNLPLSGSSLMDSMWKTSVSPRNYSSRDYLGNKRCTECGELYYPSVVTDNGRCNRCNNKIY